MKTVFVLLLFFLGVGIFARSFNRATYTLLAAGVVVAILYLYLT